MRREEKREGEERRGKEGKKIKRKRLSCVGGIFLSCI